MILDGWGITQNPSVSAIFKAKTPFINSLYNEYPSAELRTDGEHVGLPEGQMGNSEGSYESWRWKNRLSKSSKN